MRIRDITDTAGAQACYKNFCTLGTSLASADLFALAAAQFARMLLDASTSELASKLKEHARNQYKDKITMDAKPPNGESAVS